MLKGLNLTVAFLLELAMLAGFAYWGFSATDNTLLRWILGIGLPLLAIVIWGMFMAPNSKTRLTGGRYLGLKTALFGAAAVALVFAGQPVWALVFAVVATLNQVLLSVWKQE